MFVSVSTLYEDVCLSVCHSVCQVGTPGTSLSCDRWFQATLLDHNCHTPGPAAGGGDVWGVGEGGGGGQGVGVLTSCCQCHFLARGMRVLI